MFSVKKMEASSNMRVMRFFLVFLLFLVTVTAVSPSLNDDVLGLIVFKADIQDPKGKLASWNEDDESACSGSWVGVKCNARSNRVVEVNLNGFSLSGRIGRGLQRLQFLHRLYLANNNLTGSITPNIATIDNLRVLDLSNNNLSGVVPDDFFRQCGSMRVVSFAGNLFSGNIPSSLGSCSAVATIDLSGNQFEGNVPKEIWSLSGLRSLDLSDNLLEGEIPEGVEALKNLRSVDLARNSFSGKIPYGFGSCLLLRSIDFGENSFSGSIPGDLKDLVLCGYFSLRGNAFSGDVPEWIGEMKGLQTLDLSRNRFSGSVPNSLGKLWSMKTLNLSGNGFTGNLPESMVNCTNLLALDVSQNSLSGDLPSWIFGSDLEKVSMADNKMSVRVKSPLYSSTEVMVQSLQVLDLSHNAFSGEISSAVSYLSSLQVLNLSYNSLGGHIPASIGDLRTCSSLDLSYNKLNGSIPREIGGALSLKELNLENNFLIGKIPISIENCSSLTTLILSKNKLSGSIPAAVAKLTNLKTVDISVNNLNGSLPKQLANLPNLLTFNLSHNNLQGELPAGGFFNTISPSAVAGNPFLCGSIVNIKCPVRLPKPIVLNPNFSGDSDPGSPTPMSGHKRNILSISALIAIGAAAFIVIGVIGITVLNLRVRSAASRSPVALDFSAGDDYSRSPTTDANSGKLVMFSGEPDFSSGAHALLNKDCELGRGGFGAVYQTVLGDGRSVAIKKLTVSSLVKSQEDFEREVKKLGKVRHQNLVELEGYYWTSSLQLLIYEFVSRGSLYKHLHEGSGENFLSWNERFHVILGSAKALAHLHHSNIIHYNIKSTNILIDSYGEPKVGDYGLARLLPMLDRYVLSSKIQSALGYMAPEFACKTVKITEKCDVYGFGVLVLEIVTGKRPVEYMEDDVVVLCDMVRGALDEGRVEECIDERLLGKFPVEEVIPVIKLGLVCTSQVPSNRPEMGEVVTILELIRCPSEGQEELLG
ncbi:probable LRR receptor-like serine/threonine-protein kinase IRK [Vicia villosa]|uniref:probable LRR receptor-like serine/threonine-protein kinase IRK n=1 Tax=Vicia villosa TaxID=3911 RepID=UPI00273B4C1E|nr:probable LRR receptor-like serine/threonine-protein kinase IRK [Vicia villosa]